MTRLRQLGLATLGAVVGFAAFVGLRGDPANAAPAERTPILVELFTSEGCSSCPPADAVMTKLERTQPVPGARVIVLAHHVDYWNSLGWPDPWSSASATARQRTYAPLHSGAYTPQTVIDGRTEMVGSRASAIEANIAEAAKATHFAVAIEVKPAGASSFDVTVKTPSLPADAEVLIAVVQDRGRVNVAAGENTSRMLEHTAIVRSMTSGPSARVAVPSKHDAPDGTTFSVVAFAQKRTSREVLGSNAVPLK